MAIKPDHNAAPFSLSNKSLPTGEDRYPSFSSKKVLAKKEATGERRAPEFTLEQMKKGDVKNPSKRK